MGNILAWLLLHKELMLGALAVVVAAIYNIAQGEGYKLLLEVWGLVVALAENIIAEIPDSFLRDIAKLIHEALPSWARIFVSEKWIGDMLLDLRDLLTDAMTPRGVEEKAIEERLAYIWNEVNAYLA